MPGRVAAIAGARRYIELYAGREDVFGTFTPEGWRPARSRLTAARAIVAFETGEPVSFYFLPADNRTHVAAIDFDTPDGFDQGAATGVRMWGHGIPAYLETSRRGSHLWVSLDGHLHADVVRNALRVYLLEAGAPTDDDRIELRPGGPHRDPSGIGLALRAPLMPHPKTGIAGVMLDPRSLDTVAETLPELVAVVQVASAELFAAAAARYCPPSAVPASRFPVAGSRLPRASARFPSSGGRMPIAAYKAENPVSAVLVRDFGILSAAPRRTVRCPGRQHRHGDRTPSLSILPDDARAFCHVEGCVFNGGGHGVDAWDLHRIAMGELR